MEKHITWEALRLHVCEGDVWIAISNKVYNISNWGKRHPGGELVLMHAAGKDATSAFQAYHPGWVADKILDKFCIGIIQPSGAKTTKVGFEPCCKDLLRLWPPLHWDPHPCAPVT